MSRILEFSPQYMPRQHRQIWMLALQRLHSCHLIQTNGTFSTFCSFFGFCIQVAIVSYLLLPMLVLLLGQPIAEEIGSQPFFLSNRAACRGEICSTIFRC